MSTSLLYHGWGLRGHTHRRTDFIDGCIVFTTEPSTEDLRCSGCRGREVRREGGVRRRWRTTPIGGQPVFVDTTVPRLWCASCGKTRQVEIGFAPPRPSPPLPTPPRARYTNAFERYALELSASMTIQDVAHHLGVSWDVIKGTRWLLLKNPENLDDTRDEQRRLDRALELKQPLATAYYMKEDLRQLWEQRNKPAAERFLDRWIAKAQASGVRMLNKFARTLHLHRRGLLASYDDRIFTGPLEGTNHKIKTMQRQAYGYRDPAFFRLKIHASHEAAYALVG